MVQEVALNWWAVAVGALVVLAWGALWYSPLMLFKPWLARVGKSQADVSKGVALALGVTAVAAFVISWVFATVLAFAETADSAEGMLGGFFMGLFVAAVLAANDFMERRRPSLWLINSGYWMVVLLSLGALQGAWR